MSLAGIFRCCFWFLVRHPFSCQSFVRTTTKYYCSTRVVGRRDGRMKANSFREINKMSARWSSVTWHLAVCRGYILRRYNSHRSPQYSILFKRKEHRSLLFLLTWLGIVFNLRPSVFFFSFVAPRALLHTVSIVVPAVPFSSCQSPRPQEESGGQGRLFERTLLVI